MHPKFVNINGNEVLQYKLHLNLNNTRTFHKSFEIIKIRVFQLLLKTSIIVAYENNFLPYTSCQISYKV